MKVLVITRNAWDDNNSVGNTVSNFFSRVQDVEFANIYFRTQPPNNNLCKKYYQVCEKDVLKNWFSPHRIGRSFSESDNMVSLLSGQAKERKIINFIHKYKLAGVNELVNRVWDSKKWVNENLNSFIASFSPDIVFSFVKAEPQYYQILYVLRQKYHIPLFSWIADDEYSGYLRKNKKKNIDRLRYIISESTIVRGCSREICDYYNSVFGCKATPMYKGCASSLPPERKNNKCISLVYAGNLLYGRLEIIKKISDIVEKYSTEKQIIQFDIYSNTVLSKRDIQKNFGCNKSTSFWGKRNYSEIVELLKKADVTVHVESFEKKEILKTQYSFSTKIIDYLQSGSVIFAVGPDEVSSIKYIKNIPCTIVADNLQLLESKLAHLFENVQLYDDMANKTYEYAHKNHDSDSLSREMNILLNQCVNSSRNEQLREGV